MSDFDQIPYRPGTEDDDAGLFADNPDPRCPVVLVLDKSGSMAGRPIAELNAGLRALGDDLRADPLAARRVELAVVSFGPVTTDTEFGTADMFSPPELRADADTPMGRAIERALDLIDERKRRYRENGIAYYRPWLFLITDGAPTDSVAEATRRIHEAEQAKRIAAFAIGVEGADLARLSRIVVRQPIALRGLNFRDLFKWLSASMAAVSRSAPATQVLALPPPAGGPREGWPPPGWSSL